MIKPLCNIKGSFLKHCMIDDQKYWDIHEDTPHRQIPLLENVCPSDWRYREDLIWLKYNCMKIA